MLSRHLLAVIDNRRFEVLTDQTGIHHEALGVFHGRLFVLGPCAIVRLLINGSVLLLCHIKTHLLRMALAGESSDLVMCCGHTMRAGVMFMKGWRLTWTRMLA